MARTCIICGGPTGSREHIFPAALGGRRTNKGIYCADHNNAYSGLAGIIAGQLRIFNAQLGVVGDHASDTTPVTMTDVASGREVELTNSHIRFKDPHILSEHLVGNTASAEIGFSSRKEAEDWVLEQRAKGFNVQLQGQGRKTRYHVGTAHATFTLGGNDEGLCAIAYIAQTFLAHCFPDLARLPEFQGIKDYTLKNAGSGYAWWDFEPPDDLPANSFPFGHRIIIGLDKDTDTAYARVSFFSALHFSVLLGTIPVTASQCAITDIDPLAKSPPNDIVTCSEPAARSAVVKPDNFTISLANAIQSGKAQARVADLMRRITDYERGRAASSILDKIASASLPTDADRNKLFTEIVSSEAQRVFRLMRYAAAEFKRTATNPIQQFLSGLLDEAVTLDPTSVYGLTDKATHSLALASEALKKQMVDDFGAGHLDQDRMEMLIGGGPGAHAVAAALIEPLIEGLARPDVSV